MSNGQFMISIADVQRQIHRPPERVVWDLELGAYREVGTWDLVFPLIIGHWSFFQRAPHARAVHPRPVPSNANHETLPTLPNWGPLPSAPQASRPSYRPPAPRPVRDTRAGNRPGASCR